MNRNGNKFESVEDKVQKCSQITQTRIEMKTKVIS